MAEIGREVGEPVRLELDAREGHHGGGEAIGDARDGVEVAVEGGDLALQLEDLLREGGDALVAEVERPRNLCPLDAVLEFAKRQRHHRPRPHALGIPHALPLLLVPLGRQDRTNSQEIRKNEIRYSIIKQNLANLGAFFEIQLVGEDA